MKMYRLFSMILLTILLSLAASDLENAFAEESIEVSIITNKNAPQKDLSLDDIKNIFTGKTTLWRSNEKIIIALLKDDQIHKAFLKKYIKRNAAQFKNTWRQIVFLGKGDSPKRFDTIEEMISFVSRNRLAIGYITNSSSDSNIAIIAK